MNVVVKLAFYFVGLQSIAQACQPPDCDRNDCGSCGNACCLLEFEFSSLTPEDTYNLFVKNLKAGGADGRYKFIDGDDLRQYNISADFILQGWHTTLVHHYNDTLDFAFSSAAASKTTRVRAFSISQIAGAYCDSGQNYKNLVGFVKGLRKDFEESTILGCPKPSQP